MAASETAYHHSVMHYHSPFKLEHRNSTAFPDPRSPAQKIAQEAAARQAAITESFVSPTRQGATRYQAQAYDTRWPGAIVPCLLPHVTETASYSDHLMGPGMHPSPPPAWTASAADRSVIATSEEPLHPGESHALWMEQKHMIYGIHHRRRPPYVSREEFVDPLRCTSPTKKTHAGYVSVPLRGTYKSRAIRGEKAVGERRAPAIALDIPEKINRHNPFKALQPRGASPVTAPPVSARVSKPPAVDSELYEQHQQSGLLRLPATALLSEVDERLRLHGMGSLLDVRFASDEAISTLLRDVGFTPTQRMNVLWELRKRCPAPQ